MNRCQHGQLPTLSVAIAWKCTCDFSLLALLPDLKQCPDILSIHKLETAMKLWYTKSQQVVEAWRMPIVY